MNLIDGGTGLHRMVSRCPDGVFVVSGDGRVTLWNDAAERILGHQARDVVGRPCQQVLFPCDSAEEAACCCEGGVSFAGNGGGAVSTFEIHTRARSGRLIWLSVSVHAGCDEHGRRFAVHVIRDVTETRELLALVHRHTPQEHSALTRRELEILRFVATGAGTKAVAEQLKVSPSTVRNHVQNIMSKLGVHNRLQAVAYANSHRLLSREATLAVPSFR